MLQHFEEMLAGIRYLVCTYSRGPSPERGGHYQVKIYQMIGSDLHDEEVDFGEGKTETHIRLELLAIEAALHRIGATSHPIVFLTRQDYIVKYAKILRANDFKKSDRKPAANIDVWRRIEELDPDDRIEWRFAERDFDEMIEEWKAEKERDALIERAMERDSY